LQQGFWGGAQAGDEQMVGVKGFTVAPAGGRDFYDPAGADPGLPVVLRRLFGPQGPGDVTTVADLAIRCHERDLALSLELAANLAAEGLLVGLLLRRRLRLHVRRKSAPCSWSCRKTGAEYEARRPGLANPPRAH